MGGSHAKNVVDQYLSTMINVDQSSSQDCSPSTSIDQGIWAEAPISGCPGGSSIEISGNVFNATSTVTVACALKAIQDANASATIDAKIKQMAEAVTQALSFNPAKSEAENISRLTAAIGTNIKQAIKQTSNPSSAISQSIIAKKYCDVKIHDNTFNAASTMIVSSIMDSQSVSKAVADLKTAVDQSAKAKQESLFAILAIIAVIVIVIFLGGGKKGLAGVPGKPGAKIVALMTKILVIALIGCGGYFGYKAYKKHKKEKEYKKLLAIGVALGSMTQEQSDQALIKWNESWNKDNGFFDVFSNDDTT